jgi:hypothetical protein
MDSIILEYFTGLAFRAGRFKAKYLMALYREGDRQKEHLKAGVFFLATRLNFVSPDLEYLLDAYIADMQAAMQRAEAPSTWTMTTVSHLEDLARGKYFDYHSKADSAVAKGPQPPSLRLVWPRAAVRFLEFGPRCNLDRPFRADR